MRWRSKASVDGRLPVRGSGPPPAASIDLMTTQPRLRSAHAGAWWRA